jgi:hypothetical protein
VLACCRALVDFTGGPGLRKERERVCLSRGAGTYPELCEALVDAGVIAPLTAALRAHVRHAECAQWLCHAIRNLQPSTPKSEGALAAWEAGGALELLLECLARHGEAEPVLATCCGALTNLSCGGDAVAQRLVALGAVEALLDALRRRRFRAALQLLQQRPQLRLVQGILKVEPCFVQCVFCSLSLRQGLLHQLGSCGSRCHSERVTRGRYLWMGIE